MRVPLTGVKYTSLLAGFAFSFILVTDAFAQEGYGEGGSGKGSSTTVGNATTEFVYDDLGRLSKVREPATSFGVKETSFNYDAAGNRTNVVLPTIVNMTSASATEGEMIMVPVNRDGNVNLATSVGYYIEGETATSGQDYINTTGTIDFAIGETQKFISILTIADPIAEPQESLFVRFTSMTGGVSWGDEIRVYINDGPAP